jgi:HAD superfamily hydrolase (TIGR01509 family)
MGTRGALLDIDGTLLDSNDAHASAYVEALASEHLEIAFERVRPLIGMGSDNLLPALGVQPDSPVAGRVDARKKAIFAEKYLPHLRPCRGARDLLLVMKSRGLSLTVATSARAEELHDLLRVAGIADLIERQTTSSDAESSKPDPEIVQAAVVQAGLPSRDLVMLGDTPYDVAAARRAGVVIVGLRCGGWSDGDLRGAAAVYDDPADLIAAFDDSPFARG